MASCARLQGAQAVTHAWCAAAVALTLGRHEQGGAVALLCLHPRCFPALVSASSHHIEPLPPTAVFTALERRACLRTTSRWCWTRASCSSATCRWGGAATQPSGAQPPRAARRAPRVRAAVPAALPAARRACCWGFCRGKAPSDRPSPPHCPCRSTPALRAPFPAPTGEGRVRKVLQAAPGQTPAARPLVQRGRGCAQRLWAGRAGGGGAVLWSGMCCMLALLAVRTLGILPWIA